MASLQARGNMNGSSTFSPSSDQRGLFPAPVPSTFSPPPSDEFLTMGSKIMNIKAGANSSLYQICTGLRQRLGGVPGFEEHIIEMEEEEEDSADEPKDPVTLMWNCLRRGYPLMTIYNASLPARPLRLDPKIREDKIGKTTTFKFLQACMTEFMIPSHECFLITDLFGEDTTGFVKVTKLVNRVLDILDERGLLQHNERPRIIAVAVADPTSYKARIIDELLTTERDYIQHLEILQEFKRQVTGAIAGDAIHDIFLNLNQLLDFQRRFLVRIEQQNGLSEEEQNWGKLFSYYRESFRVYEPFIANQNRCNETVLSVWPKLKKAELSNDLKGIVETPSILLSFLIKPFQRLSKYPMLLTELRTKGNLDPEKQRDLEDGEAAAKSIMSRADEAVQKEHHAAAVNELQSRVEDWKGHRINHFGELLHFGNYVVLKGEGAKVVEREVSVIFDSLDPVTRALVFSLFMHSLHRGTPKPLCPQSWTSALQTLRRYPHEKHVSDLASVPEPPAEERYSVPMTPKTPSRRSVFSFRVKSAPRYPQTPSHTSVEPPPWSPFRFKFTRRKGAVRETPGIQSSKNSSDIESPRRANPPEEQAIEILQNALQVLKIGTEPEPASATPGGVSRAVTLESSRDDKYLRIMDWPHNTPFRTEASEDHPSKALTPLQFLLLKSIRQAGHLCKLDGPFKNTTLFLFSYAQLSDPASSLAALAALAAAVPSAESKPISYMQKEVADEFAIKSLVREQYKVYLFERILLCCKEINPNKPKNKMLAAKQPLVDKKGKLKLQLKGRIFMQNVTDVVTLNQGQYTLQIFWKGDPGVENFVIRFPDEAQMIKWRDTVQKQKQSLCEQARNSGQTGTSATEFNYMRDQVLLNNPYQEDEDMEEEDSHSGQITGPIQSSFTVSRNPSSNSLRSIAGPSRMAPPRFPLAEHGNEMYAPPLSLNTNIAPGTAASPGEFPGNSYFSPTNDSPTSTRTTSQQSFSQFTRQQTAAGHWPHEENKHRTAPAMGRAPSREGPAPPNSYVVNGRTVTRPSLPVMAASQNHQQQLVQQSRLRSASTPDIHNLNAPGARRTGTSHLPTQAENVPMPPIPSHMVQGRAPLNRSQTSSPVDGQLPIRTATQPPSVHRDRAHRQYQEPPSYDRQRQRTQQSFESESRDYHHRHYAEEPTQLTPPSTETSSSANSIMDYPNQLKVRVKFDPEPSHVTIVVPTFIKHRSLTDRIDSKMAKITSASIAKKTARLLHEDSDGDMITIETDEDVHIAIEDWATQNERQILEGPAPDFELHWQQN